MKELSVVLFCTTERFTFGNGFYNKELYGIKKVQKDNARTSSTL